MSLQLSKRLIRISRPAFWGFGPLLFIYPFFAQSIFPGPAALLTLFLLSFPACLMVFGINDIHDRKTDLLNPRKKKYFQGAIIRKDEALIVLLSSLFIGAALIIIPIISGNTTAAAISSILVLLSFAYSTPPLRLKERPPLDSISNAFMIYLIAALGYSYATGDYLIPPGNFTGIGAPLLLAIVSIHMFSTIMDYTPDRKAGVLTISTAIGKRMTALLSFGLLAAVILIIESDNLFIRAFLWSSLFLTLSYFIFSSEASARRISIMQGAAFIICALFAVTMLATG